MKTAEENYNYTSMMVEYNLNNAQSKVYAEEFREAITILEDAISNIREMWNIKGKAVE